MTPQERKVFELALEYLENHMQTHYYCEDTWYSCPKHEEGSINESKGNECDCGADKANAEIDKTIVAIKEVLAQPKLKDEKGRPMTYWGGMAQPELPPECPMDSYGDGNVYRGQRSRDSAVKTITWVGLTKKEVLAISKINMNIIDMIYFVEAKVREKNHG